MTEKAVVEWQQLPIACCSEWYQQFAMHGNSHGNGPFCVTQDFFCVKDMPDDTAGPYPWLKYVSPHNMIWVNNVP